MRWVQPKVFLIAQTQVNRDQMNEWLNHHNVSAEAASRDHENKTHGEHLVELAGRRCYMSFEPGLNPNVRRIREDITQYIDNILASGHGSVIEHVTYTFAIENVSRVFTGEMNRHRAGFAISEGSMRFIRFDDIPMVEVPSLRKLSTTASEALKRERTRMCVEAVAQYVELQYKTMCDIWADELAPGSTFANKKNVTSMLRRIVPMGVATGGVWTGNLRALRHVCTMRCSKAAEEEILEVACMILDVLRRAEPTFFADFTEDGPYRAPKYTKV